jgi:heme/copper-type cytochrome/quinol oxidase subunit 2
MEMRIAVLWSVLVIANVANLAMLVTLWRARSSAALRRVRSSGAVELAWAAVPWLMTALIAAPTVHHILATGQRMSGSAGAAVLAPTPIPGTVLETPSPSSGMERENVAPGPGLLASAQRRP